jgi:hypothetical protein
VYLLGGNDPSGRLNITSQNKNIQYMKAYTTQVYQLIGQCRSRHNLSLIIWEARVVES